MIDWLINNSINGYVNNLVHINIRCTWYYLCVISKKIVFKFPLHSEREENCQPLNTSRWFYTHFIRCYVIKVQLREKNCLPGIFWRCFLMKSRACLSPGRDSNAFTASPSEIIILCYYLLILFEPLTSVRK